MRYIPILIVAAVALMSCSSGDADITGDPVLVNGEAVSSDSLAVSTADDLPDQSGSVDLSHTDDTIAINGHTITINWQNDVDPVSPEIFDESPNFPPSLNTIEVLGIYAFYRAEPVGDTHTTWVEMAPLEADTAFADPEQRASLFQSHRDYVSDDPQYSVHYDEVIYIGELTTNTGLICAVDLRQANGPATTGIGEQTAYVGVEGPDTPPFYVVVSTYAETDDYRDQLDLTTSVTAHIITEICGATPEGFPANASTDD